MIRSIELRNWKTHKDTRLDFSKGTNIMIGQMGAGKSSVMDAISFALFGTFPAIQRRRVNVSKLIRNKPSQQNVGSVQLILELGTDRYTIKREISLGGKSTATVEKNGVYLQSQPERVTEEIESILKVDYDLFSKAVYSEQNQLNYFLDLRSSDRKKQIDGLLGLDKFAIAQDNATTLTNRIKDMINDSERITREFDLVKASSGLATMKSELEKLRMEKRQTENSIKMHTEERSRLESNVDKLKEQNNKKISLAKEMEGIRSRISLLESEIKKLENLGLPKRDVAESTKKSLHSQLEKIRESDKRSADEERVHQSDIAKLRAEIDNAKKNILERDRIAKELEKSRKADTAKRLSECNDNIEKLNTEIAHSKSIVSDATNQVKELKGHVNKCPICERELDPDTLAKILEVKGRSIKEHASRAKELEEALAKTRTELKQLTSLSNSAAIMEDKQKEYSGIDGKLKTYESRLEIATAAFEKTKTARDGFNKEIQSLSENLQKAGSVLESIERTERHVSEVARLAKDMTEKTAEYDGIEVDEKQIDKLQNALIISNSEISKHTANLNSIIRYEKEKADQIKEKEFEVEKIGRLQQELLKKKSLAENLSKFRTALSETQSIMRSQLINSINDIMQSVWKELYPYADYLGITLDVADDDYSLKVKTMVNNEYVWEDVESIASGGERSTACLAMRIAFSLVLVPNLKWLILDEPTHNIDQEGLSRFIRMFSERLPGIIDQVFIITHDDVLKQVSNARIYVLNRNKEENGETVVSEA